MSDTATAPDELAKLDAQSAARYAAFRAVDRRGLDEWGRDNIVMGEGWSAWPGRFDPSITPMICEPLQRLGGTGPKRVTVIGPAAGSKSTIGEVLIAWVIDNAPGLTVWFTETIDTAKEFAESRLNRVLAACPRVASWFAQMPRHAKRTQEIHFPHMSFLVRAANETQAQSKHIRHMVCDETWRYPAGMLAMLHKRTTRFAHNRTILELSTGSLDGDETHEAYNLGSRQEWQVYCPSCQQYHIPKWTFGKGKPGGVKWSPLAKRADGSWNFRIVTESTYYECPLCSAQYAANAANGYALNHAGKFTAPHSEMVPNHWSFHWNCIATDFAQLGTVAVEYLLAKAASRRGTTVLLQEFTQKKLAEAWVENITDDATARAVSDYTMADDIPAGWVVLMAVDCQQTHYWVAVRAFAADGTMRSRLVACARVESMDGVREFQLSHGVPDDSVLVDTGKWPDAGYTACCHWGWHALKGEKVPGGYLVEQADGSKIRALCRQSDARPTPANLAPGSVLNSCALFLVSDELTSEILANARSGGVEGWTIPADAPDFYRAQLAARIRRQSVVKSTGRKVLEWVTIGKQGEHLWDCERYLLAAAFIAGAFDFKPTTTTETKDENADGR